MTPAALFFDDEQYLRTVLAEKPPVASAVEAHGAARLAGCRPGSLILDAGCGHGRHAHPLARAGYKVVALDRSRMLLAAAQRASRGARRPHFVRGSYASLPFEPGSFDAVLCLGTALGYLGDEADRAALREFRRVLAPGGRLVIETLHSREIGARLSEHEERPLPTGGVLRFDRRFDRARGVMRETQRLENGTGDGSPRAYELRVYSEHELQRMLEDAGFAFISRHASLAGPGEPSPATPLVLVAGRDEHRGRCDEETAARRGAAAVVGWRSARLRQDDFGYELPEQLSHDRGVDLHALIELVETRCAPPLAARIPAPLEHDKRPC
jgi:SAM-dependent methyltransferase